MKNFDHRQPSFSPQPAFNRCELAREALRQALRIRMQLKLGLYAPVCPFDVAKLLGVEVKMQNIPSMEGMFCRMQGQPLIVLSSQRPAGRQNFSCAHELGHFAFGHGESLDEMLDNETFQSRGTRSRRHTDPHEFLADSFAGFLLMPKSVVDRAFAVRGIEPKFASPEQIYVIAGYLGVGYRTLVTHLQSALHLISPDKGEELRKWATKLSKIRYNLTGSVLKHVTVADAEWEDHPIDLRTGDHLVLPSGWLGGEKYLEAAIVGLSRVGDGIQLFQAARQGECTIQTTDGRLLKVRISRLGYSGRAIFRHLDDPDEDEQGGDL